MTRLLCFDYKPSVFAGDGYVRLAVRGARKVAASVLSGYQGYMAMARRCGITGKTVQFGNNVSHSNRKTRRRFKPNLQTTSLMSDALGRMISLRLTMNGLRTIEHNGGLDSFLTQAKAADLGLAERKLKKQVEKASARKAASSSPAA